jgi:hypothetical protein
MLSTTGGFICTECSGTLIVSKVSGMCTCPAGRFLNGPETCSGRVQCALSGRGGGGGHQAGCSVRWGGGGRIMCTTGCGGGGVQCAEGGLCASGGGGSFRRRGRGRCTLERGRRLHQRWGRCSVYRGPGLACPMGCSHDGPEPCSAQLTWHAACGAWWVAVGGTRQ